MQKFLVVRFSSIGDIVLTTPVIRCLKQQVAGAEVHVLTKKIFEPVLKENPYIDRLMLMDENLMDILPALKKEKYDAVIDLHHNQRTMALKRALGTKRFSFHKLNVEKWLLVNFRINRLPNIHIVDRYMDTVKSFGVTNDGRGLDYFITAEDEMAVHTLPPSFEKGYLAFVIGAKHVTKQLPVEKIISICKNIQSPVVLLGGKEDFEKAESITLACGPHVLNACGKYPLNQSAALVKHARKVITHDTGLMHIAAAFQKDILSIWGNTVPAFGMSPYKGIRNSFSNNQQPTTRKGQGTRDKGRGTEVDLRNSFSNNQQPTTNNQNGTRDEGQGADMEPNDLIVEVEGLSCRPCSKIGYKKCPKGHFRCMNDIDEIKIVEWANKS